MTNPRLEILEQLAELARVLGNAHRLDLLDHVAQGERSVERLADVTGLTFANVSQHLQQLRRVNLVRSRRDGKRVLYALGDGPIVSLLSALRVLGEQNLSTLRELVAANFSRLDDLEPISRNELVDRLRRGEVMLLDVRPPEEYAAGHVAGAVNVPEKELEVHLSALPKNQEIVAYCRGTYCLQSFRAVAKLRELGFSVRRLEDGFPEWKEAGLKVESTQ
ncbi:MULTISPECIES: metalloregulator ArsR/SmtB family transcription factor [unclassified Burkholderia]|uniref:ArsR/SmtB family transcription factor n=1 Tax=unclassified Burkholderia TaxID=2613784 RepID=UPI002AB2CD66|nr:MULTISPECIES: metalloregulator ArsR/SmtB family transcription factor [unclassified Burkholderia]